MSDKWCDDNVARSLRFAHPLRRATRVNIIDLEADNLVSLGSSVVSLALLIPLTINVFLHLMDLSFTPLTPTKPDP